MLIVLLCIIFLAVEISLRQKYTGIEGGDFVYTVDNFHPFLQAKLDKHENLHVNSLGYRGEEICVKKPENTYRIVVLAGSTVLNREVTFEENAVRLLEKKLRQKYPNKKIEVINAGKDYYTSEHSIIQYIFNISELKPDLVIMYHGLNDMWMSCLAEGTYTHGAFKSDYSHFFGVVGRMVFNYFEPKPIIQVKLVSLDLLLRVVSDNLYSDITNKLKSSARTQIIIDLMHKKNTVSTHTYPSLDTYGRNLTYLIKLTREHQVPLILGNQPSLLKKTNSFEEVNKMGSFCKKGDRYYDLDSLKFGLDLFNNQTKKIAQEYDVIIVDLD
jgi:lysophospholipase L1-like esterase